MFKIRLRAYLGVRALLPLFLVVVVRADTPLTPIRQEEKVRAFETRLTQLDSLKPSFAGAPEGVEAVLALVQHLRAEMAAMAPAIQEARPKIQFQKIQADAQALERQVEGRLRALRGELETHREATQILTSQLGKYVPEGQRDPVQLRLTLDQIGNQFALGGDLQFQLERFFDHVGIHGAANQREVQKWQGVVAGYRSQVAQAKAAGPASDLRLPPATKVVPSPGAGGAGSVPTPTQQTLMQKAVRSFHEAVLRLPIPDSLKAPSARRAAELRNAGIPDGKTFTAAQLGVTLPGLSPTTVFTKTTHNGRAGFEYKDAQGRLRFESLDQSLTRQEILVQGNSLFIERQTLPSGQVIISVLGSKNERFSSTTYVPVGHGRFRSAPEGREWPKTTGRFVQGEFVAERIEFENGNYQIPAGKDAPGVWILKRSNTETIGWTVDGLAFQSIPDPAERSRQIEKTIAWIVRRSSLGQGVSDAQFQYRADSMASFLKDRFRHARPDVQAIQISFDGSGKMTLNEFNPQGVHQTVAVFEPTGTGWGDEVHRNGIGLSLYSRHARSLDDPQAQFVKFAQYLGNWGRELFSSRVESNTHKWYSWITGPKVSEAPIVTRTYRRPDGTWEDRGHRVEKTKVDLYAGPGIVGVTGEAVGTLGRGVVDLTGAAVSVSLATNPLYLGVVKATGGDIRAAQEDLLARAKVNFFNNAVSTQLGENLFGERYTQGKSRLNLDYNRYIQNVGNEMAGYGYAKTGMVLQAGVGVANEVPTLLLLGGTLSWVGKAGRVGKIVETGAATYMGAQVVYGAGKATYNFTDVALNGDLNSEQGLRAIHDLAYNVFMAPMTFAVFAPAFKGPGAPRDLHAGGKTYMQQQFPTLNPQVKLPGKLGVLDRPLFEGTGQWGNSRIGRFLDRPYLAKNELGQGPVQQRLGRGLDYVGQKTGLTWVGERFGAGLERMGTAWNRRSSGNDNAGPGSLLRGIGYGLKGGEHYKGGSGSKPSGATSTPPPQTAQRVVTPLPEPVKAGTPEAVPPTAGQKQGPPVTPPEVQKIVEKKLTDVPEAYRQSVEQRQGEVRLVEVTEVISEEGSSSIVLGANLEGRLVAVKSYLGPSGHSRRPIPKAQAQQEWQRYLDYFNREMEAARDMERILPLGMAPKVYGEVNLGPKGNPSWAMERVYGKHPENLTPVEIRLITPETLRQAAEATRRLVQEGYEIGDSPQPMVLTRDQVINGVPKKAGDVVFVDPGGLRKTPPGARRGYSRTPEDMAYELAFSKAAYELFGGLEGKISPAQKAQIEARARQHVQEVLKPQAAPEGQGASGQTARSYPKEMERYFTYEEFRSAHPEPQNGAKIYHDWRHSMNVSKMAHDFAVSRGLSPVDSKFISEVALLHDYNPAAIPELGVPGRKPGSPASVPQTLERLRLDFEGKVSLTGEPGRSMFRERFGWSEAQLRMAEAMIQRTEFPFGDSHPSPFYKEASPLARYEAMLRSLPPGDRRFVLREGALLSEYADKSSWYSMKGFNDAYEVVDGLVNEINTSVGKPVMDIGKLNTQDFLSKVGTPESFALDYALAERLGLGPLELPTRGQAFAQMPAKYGRVFEANLEGFKAFQEAVGRGEGFESAKQVGAEAARNALLAPQVNRPAQPGVQQTGLKAAQTSASAKSPAHRVAAEFERVARELDIDPTLVESVQGDIGHPGTVNPLRTPKAGQVLADVQTLVGYLRSPKGMEVLGQAGGIAGDAVRVRVGGEVWYLKRVSKQLSELADAQLRVLSPTERAANEIGMREIVRRYFGESFGVAEEAIVFKSQNDTFVLTKGIDAKPARDAQGRTLPPGRKMSPVQRADYSILRLIFRTEDMHKENILFDAKGKPYLIDFEKVLVQPIRESLAAEAAAVSPGKPVSPEVLARRRQHLFEKMVDQEVVAKNYPMVDRTARNDLAPYLERVKPWDRRFNSQAPDAMRFREEFRQTLRESGWSDGRIDTYFAAIRQNLRDYPDYMGAYVRKANGLLPK